MENGKTFSIVSHFIKPNAKYIISAKLNGNDHKQSFIPYEEITKGGTLDLWIDDKHDGTWGTGDNVPVDSISFNDVVPEPYFKSGSITFSDSVQVALEGYTSRDTIRYTIIDSNRAGIPELYKTPFYLRTSGTVMCWLTRDGKGSMENTASYTKIPKGRTISLLSQPDAPYLADGPVTLIDYQHGTTDFSTGSWQGYEGKDFEAIVDLGKIQVVKKLGAEFLQDVGSWILMPRFVDISISTDNTNYIPLIHKVNLLPDNDYTANIQTFGEAIAPQNARYIKVFAKNYGKLPAWHEGAGGDAWIFIDEIMVE